MKSPALLSAIRHYEKAGFLIIPCLDPLIDFIACSAKEAVFVHLYRDNDQLMSFELKRLPSKIRREAVKCGSTNITNRISYPQ